jgi:hypothetical protein
VVDRAEKNGEGCVTVEAFKEGQQFVDIVVWGERDEVQVVVDEFDGMIGIPFDEPFGRIPTPWTTKDHTRLTLIPSCVRWENVTSKSRCSGLQGVFSCLSLRVLITYDRDLAMACLGGYLYCLVVLY